MYAGFGESDMWCGPKEVARSTSMISKLYSVYGIYIVAKDLKWKSGSFLGQRVVSQHCRLLTGLGIHPCCLNIRIYEDHVHNLFDDVRTHVAADDMRLDRQDATTHWVFLYVS